MPKTGYTRLTDEFVTYWWGGGRTYLNRYRYAYRFDHGGYHRNPRTQNERRQNFAHEDDGLPVRRRRLGPLPHSYDDLGRSRTYGKSWKDYTKRRHQWETR